MLAKYWMTLLVFTVFPAPDSPLRIQAKYHKVCYFAWELLLEMFEVLHQQYQALPICSIFWSFKSNKMHSAQKHFKAD